MWRSFHSLLRKCRVRNDIMRTQQRHVQNKHVERKGYVLTQHRSRLYFLSLSQAMFLGATMARPDIGSRFVASPPGVKASIHVSARLRNIRGNMG